jgi:hypothetical protein
VVIQNDTDKADHLYDEFRYHDNIKENYEIEQDDEFKQ